MPRRVSVICLSGREHKTLVRLLGLLQEHLESAIEASVVPGTTESNDPADQQNIEIDRRDWRCAENLVKRLEAC